MRILVVLGLLLIMSPSFADADTLQDRMTYWRGQAFSCNPTGLSPFPSKVGTVSPTNPLGCDDGDMTLFNALLCSAGEAPACDAVKGAKDKQGRWWRSPRRIGIEHTPTNNEDDSFSPDQALGVLLYVISKNASNDFSDWASWIDLNRPCWLKLGGSCVVQGWPRYCPDDISDKRCTFRPVDCALLETVGSSLGYPLGRSARRRLRVSA